MPRRIPEYGYSRFDNVMTTLEFERLINAAGPTQGELVRPSDLQAPERVAFVNCVGSRDVRFNPYCSNFCCMESIKDALLIKEHWPDVAVTIFYMDIRAFGKGFEELYRRSRQEGIRYVRGRPSRILEDPRSNKLKVMVEDTRSDVLLSEEFDMVVLSVGADGPEAVPLPLARSPEGFYIEAHPKLKPVDSPSDGVFIAGGAESPKDIRETVTQASAAAGRAAGLMLRREVHIEPLFAFADTESCNCLRHLCHPLSLSGHQRQQGEKDPGPDQPRPVQGMRHLRCRLSPGLHHHDQFYRHHDPAPD